MLLLVYADDQFIPIVIGGYKEGAWRTLLN